MRCRCIKGKLCVTRRGTETEKAFVTFAKFDGRGDSYNNGMSICEGHSNGYVCATVAKMV